MLVSFTAIGRNIRAARTAKGLTQDRAAERLQISPLHYGRLERGERPASLEQLAQVARALDVSVPDLLVGSIEGETFGRAPAEDARSLSDAIAEIALGCSPEAQELMLSLCRTVAAHDKKTAPR